MVLYMALAMWSPQHCSNQMKISREPCFQSTVVTPTCFLWPPALYTKAKFKIKEQHLIFHLTRLQPSRLNDEVCSWANWFAVFVLEPAISTESHPTLMLVVFSSLALADCGCALCIITLIAAINLHWSPQQCQPHPFTGNLFFSLTLFWQILWP